MASDERAAVPGDGSCRCGAVPVNADGLCATCVDERAAVPDDQHTVVNCALVDVQLSIVKRGLAELDLHVVTAAQMRVLEAMAAFTLSGLKWMRQQWEIPERIELEAAELARRESKP